MVEMQPKGTEPDEVEEGVDITHDAVLANTMEGVDDVVYAIVSNDLLYLNHNHFAANQQPAVMTMLANRSIGVMFSPRKQMEMKAPMKGATA